MKTIDVVSKIEETLAKQDVVPWEVRRLFSEGLRIGISNEQVSFGGDYEDVGGARRALEWLVDQLGGKVKWKS